MWETGQQQARKMIDVYANIDILRPYFDIEPNTLMWRIAFSFVPVRNISAPQVKYLNFVHTTKEFFILCRVCFLLNNVAFQKIPGELYGPLMTVLTLIAILLMNMKTSGTVLVKAFE